MGSRHNKAWGMADQSAARRWILIHLTRVWTALFTLAGLGAAFVYKPEWLTLYLRTTYDSDRDRSCGFTEVEVNPRFDKSIPQPECVGGYPPSAAV